jgi:branched-subunit amino acid aminotransferase/4-amino-4-deoxychorismate lyase
MSSSTFVNYNGNILPADQPVLMANNRAFRYGDAVFETIRLMYGDILFFEKHLNRLRRSMHLLGMKWRDDFNFHNLHLLIRHLDQLNDLKGNGRIRLEVFRNEGGGYTPESNEVSFMIEAEPLQEKEYQLNENPLRIDVFMDIPKSKNKFSSIKSSNALVYVMAGIYKMQQGLDDCILINTDGKITEAITANIFLVSKDEVYTPSLTDGCVAGVMREQLTELLKERGKKIHETTLSIEHVLKADEVFLANVIGGIRWVGAFRQKRYFNSFSKALLAELNEVQVKKV